MRIHASSLLAYQYWEAMTLDSCHGRTQIVKTLTRWKRKKDLNEMPLRHRCKLGYHSDVPSDGEPWV